MGRQAGLGEVGVEHGAAFVEDDGHAVVVGILVGGGGALQVDVGPELGAVGVGLHHIAVVIDQNQGIVLPVAEVEVVFGGAILPERAGPIQHVAAHGHDLVKAPAVDVGREDHARVVPLFDDPVATAEVAGDLVLRRVVGGVHHRGLDAAAQGVVAVLGRQANGRTVLHEVVVGCSIVHEQVWYCFPSGTVCTSFSVFNISLVQNLKYCPVCKVTHFPEPELGTNR